MALNKCDALTDEEIKEKIAALQKVTKNQVFAISAVAGKNLQDCLSAVDKFVTRNRKTQNQPVENEQIETTTKPWSPLD